MKLEESPLKSGINKIHKYYVFYFEDRSKATIFSKTPTNAVIVIFSINFS
jgi:hypothetical protein